MRLGAKQARRPRKSAHRGGLGYLGTMIYMMRRGLYVVNNRCGHTLSVDVLSKRFPQMFIRDCHPRSSTAPPTPPPSTETTAPPTSPPFTEAVIGYFKILGFVASAVTAVGIAGYGCATVIGKLEELSTKIDTRFDTLKTEINTKFDTLNTKIDTSVNIININIKHSDTTFNNKIDSLEKSLDVKLKRLEDTPKFNSIEAGQSNPGVSPPTPRGAGRRAQGWRGAGTAVGGAATDYYTFTRPTPLCEGCCSQPQHHLEEVNAGTAS